MLNEKKFFLWKTLFEKFSIKGTKNVQHFSSL